MPLLTGDVSLVTDLGFGEYWGVSHVAWAVAEPVRRATQSAGSNLPLRAYSLHVRMCQKDGFHLSNVLQRFISVPPIC